MDLGRLLDLDSLLVPFTGQKLRGSLKMSAGMCQAMLLEHHTIHIGKPSKVDQKVGSVTLKMEIQSPRNKRILATDPRRQPRRYRQHHPPSHGGFELVLA